MLCEPATLESQLVASVVPMGLFSLPMTALVLISVPQLGTAAPGEASPAETALSVPLGIL